MVSRVSPSFRIRSMLLLTAICTVFFSFTEKVGGDSFSIYLNNNLLFEQFVHRDAGVKSITLTQASDNDVLKVHYYHCGKIGSDRRITIRDARDKILKTWDFESTGSMSCKVKELVALQKANGNLKLFYTAEELSDGKVLANIVAGSDTKASLGK